jgi:hypothetical protein
MSSATRSSKRGAAASVAHSEPAPSRPAAAKKRKVSKARSVASRAEAEEEDDPEDALTRDAENRAFWEEFPTPLLQSWWRDYPDHLDFLAPAMESDRERLLDALVQRAERPNPQDGSSDLLELQLVWRQANPDADPADCPGPLTAQFPPASAAQAMRYAGGGTPQASAAAAMPPRSHPPPVPSVTKRLTFESAYVRPEPPEEKYHLPQQRFSCGICLVRPEQGAPDDEGRWLCVCGLRGDLAIDDPVNVHLAQERARKADQALAAAGRTAPGAAAGQSTKDSSPFAPDYGLSALEKKFKSLIHSNSHRGFPLFEDVSPVSGQSALDTSAKAFAATAFDPPSKLLLDLIRAGLLTQVGYAIPLAAGRDRSSELVIGGFTLSETLGIAPQGKMTATQAPPVSSLHEFCLAMFSTILPALIDRPAAMMEWIALGRSALAMSGPSPAQWPAAASYIDQLLAERVPQRKGFAEPSDAVIRTVKYMHNSFGPGGGAPLAGGAGGGDKPARPRTCNGFNSGRDCSSTPCNFPHQCEICASRDHGKAVCPRRQGGGGSGRGGRGGGRGGGGGARGGYPAASPAGPARKEA